MNKEDRIEALERRVAELERRLPVSSANADIQQLVHANSAIILAEIDKLAAETDLADGPQFFLGASPIFSAAIPSLFESSSAPVIKHFEHPEQTRENGFVPYRGNRQSAIVEGSVRQLVFRNQARRITQSGEFTALFDGGDDFLCWAMRGPGWPLKPSELAGPWTINSLVLIEATYNCVLLAKTLLSFAEPEPSMTQFMIGFRNLSRDGIPPYLLNGKADREMLMKPRVQGPKGDCIYSITVPKDEKPPRIAFRLIAEIYHFFNLTDDQIPYSAIVDGRRLIDANQF